MEARIMDLLIGVVNIATDLDELIDEQVWLLHGNIFVNGRDKLPTTFFFSTAEADASRVGTRSE